MKNLTVGDAIQVGSTGRWEVVDVSDCEPGKVQWYELSPLDDQKCTKAALSIRPDGTMAELLRWGVE